MLSSMPRPHARLLPLLALSASLILLSLTPAPAFAAWENGFWASVIEPTTTTAQLQVCSDGQGGSLIAALDPGATPWRISLTRLDHTGNEVWGDGGIQLPFDLTSAGQITPLALANDGQGGAFCAYGEIFGITTYLSVAHVSGDGTWQGKVIVGNLGAIDSDQRAFMVPTGSGDVILVWNLNNPYPDQRLVAARVTSALTVAWQMDTGLSANVTPDPPELWMARPDGQGGVLVASNHQPFGGNVEHRAQRLSDTGAKPWGGAGTLVWQNFTNIVDIVAGASGDAFVVASTGYADATAQHLDATGAPTWTAAGVAVLPTYTYPLPNQPVACTDQAGGFFVVAGVDDLVAQRVGPAGGLLWGAAGVTLTGLAGWQSPAAVASDLHGGLLVTCEDHYYSYVGDPYAHAVSALRVDAFGNTLWARDGFWWTQLYADPDWRLKAPVVVADGSGGGQVIWTQYEDSWGRNRVYAAGLGPAGATPPVPSLAALWPDGGAPGEVLGLLALGDYLDPGQTFALEQNGTTIPLTGVALAGSTLLTGTVALGAAPAGAYDLVCRDGGTMVATLGDAFGLGAAPGCGGDRPMEMPDHAVNSFGSQRKAAFGPDGRAHYAWLAYNPDLGTHEVHRWVGDGEAGDDELIHRTVVPLRDLAFALGPEGDPHFVFVADDGASEELHYIRGPQHFSRPFNDGVRSPALAVAEDGRAMIVFESDIMGSSWLFYLEADDNGLGTQTDLISGAGARQPDVSLAPAGFVLSYVRDFWFPGLREVCRQHYADGYWQGPESMHFGVTVTSPTVAWDGGEMLLFGWVLDNAGNQPLLHTMRMIGGVAEPVRWRLGDGLIYRCSVAATGPRTFRLLTQESESGVPMKVYLRSGDGNVFHARRRVNTHDDVDFPVLAAERGGNGLFAAWQDFDLGHTPVSYYYCRSPVSALPPDAAVARGLHAYPNPFNPRTTFHFVTAVPGQAELEVYDLRGRLVRRLHTGLLPVGAHAFVWDGDREDGRRAPSGVYFGRLRTTAGEMTAKVLLLK